jgi:limonene 1,2-monooxygenase
MLGIEQASTRPRLEEGLDAIMALLRSGEPVTMSTAWFTLDEAELHLAPFSRPQLEVAVAAAVSPTGARLAGKHGVGLLSIAATSGAGFEALRSHWQVMEEQANEHGTTVSRQNWRLAGPMHLAETREQAYRDVEYGLMDWAIYFKRVGAVPQLQVHGSTTRELIDMFNGEGLGVIGTPEDAVAQLTRLQEQSEGFGCYLLIGHDWASPEATNRSHELFARWVMPEFQGALDTVRRSRQHSIDTFAELSAAQAAALEAAKRRYAPGATPRS